MRFQASENQPDSNDKVDCGNEMSSPDVEAENETTENNSSQIQNGSSSQESAENIQDNPANTENQAQAETEITESEKLNSVDTATNSCMAAAAMEPDLEDHRASTTEPDPEDHSTDRTGTMSPKSFATFKGFLVHPPQMNLPWESMRSVRQCTCGVTFSYSVRKVRK